MSNNFIINFSNAAMGFDNDIKQQYLLRTQKCNTKYL